MTATVQAGMISPQLDDRLSTRGLGLPIIGDHNHITVGGFASVGGISPASHRFGLFVDTIERIEYVNWDGEVITASRTENPDQFYAVLTGRGQHGVIATVTVKLIKIDKYTTVLKNHENHYFDVAAFITGAGATIANPGDEPRLPDMDSLTSNDPDRRQKVDPNVYYSSRFHGPQTGRAAPGS